MLKNSHFQSNNKEITGNGKLVVERVNNYKSSICGSNSSDFEQYVNGRKRERERMDVIEAQALKEKEEAEYAAKVAKNKLETEERLKKNALKRKRKQEKKKQNKENKKELNSDGDANEEMDDEDEDVETVNNTKEELQEKELGKIGEN